MVVGMAAAATVVASVQLAMAAVAVVAAAAEGPSRRRVRRVRAPKGAQNVGLRLTGGRGRGGQPLGGHGVAKRDCAVLVHTEGVAAVAAHKTGMSARAYTYR
jgi:hypothetical protein